jgi:hypothetical protein
MKRSLDWSDRSLAYSRFRSGRHSPAIYFMPSWQKVAGVLLMAMTVICLHASPALSQELDIGEEVPA